MGGARKTSYFTFLFLLMISSQLINGVNCRPLIGTNTVAAASKEQGQELGGADVEIVKTSRQNSVKNMAFIMVSGPSRKGPGH